MSDCFARMRIASLVVLAVIASTLFAAPPPSDPRLVLDAGFHTTIIRRVSASEDGSRLLSSGDDKTARLYDGSGVLLRVLRVPVAGGNEGKLFACALSGDGALAAVGGWTAYDFEGKNSIYIFDTATGTLVRRIAGLPGAVNNLAFAPPASGTAHLACSLGGGNGVRVFDARTGSEVFKDSPFGKTSYGCAFSSDGAYLAAAATDGILRVYRRTGNGYGDNRTIETKSGKNPFQLSFGASGSKVLLAAAYLDVAAVDIYEVSASELRYAYSPDVEKVTGGTFSCVAFSVTGTGEPILVAGGRYQKGGEELLLIWDGAGRGARRELAVGLHDTIMDIRPLRDGGFLVGAASPALVRLGPDLASRFSLQPPIADFRNDQAWDGFRISTDGSTFNFAYRIRGGDPASFSFGSRTLSSPVSLEAQDRSSLEVKGWLDTYKPTLRGAPIELEANESSRSLAIAPDHRSFLLGSDWNLRRYSSEGALLWRIAAPSTPWAVAVSGDGRLGAAAYSDGTIRWYRYDTGAELLTFFPHPDKTRWVAWTPSGYYMASAGAEDFIGWHLNNDLDSAPDFYPVSRFRSTFYRPDAVALVLSTLDEKAAVAQADSASGRKEQITNVGERRPPTISVLSPFSGSAFTGETVRISYRVRAPADAPVVKVRALVDGRPAGGSGGESGKGISVTAKNDADLFIDVPVPAKTCLVSLIADNKNGSSEAATIQLVRQAGDDFVIKPKLYVLAVGVSAYENPDFRLKYAAKDARDLAAALEKQKGGIYREVVTKVLADGNATKDDILDGLEWIQKETTSKDIALMYFSGHGINDTNQNYYFLPVETDLERLKRTGVPFSDITTTVASISGKVLFFIDTCHSGNLMKGRKAVGTERDVVAVVNELSSAENGAVVFASSTGTQYSYEDPAWSNGAFTKALIEGISGKAAYGGGDRITVNMLDLYISERVKELTGGKQTPATTKPANVPDFPLATRR